MINSLSMLAQVVAPRENCESSKNNSDACFSILPEVKADNEQLQRGLAVIFGVFAAVAVIMIIIAGINFVNSEGNPEKISNAKRTIIFALIGLIIALSAEAIVFTVLRKI